MKVVIVLVPALFLAFATCQPVDYTIYKRNQPGFSQPQVTQVFRPDNPFLPKINVESADPTPLAGPKSINRLWKAGSAVAVIPKPGLYAKVALKRIDIDREPVQVESGMDNAVVE
ncbi:Hypothetical protein D9617_15g042970 [Elsinoe fawcettii]|nr:Hypothetical protein D9617_15g042970 [Elsinoe fawcettii]